MVLLNLRDHDTWWHLPALLLLTVLVFYNTLFFEFVWDDHVFLVGQAAYESVTLKQLWLTPLNGVEYLPLRDLSYIIDYKIWGWNPFGFHRSNLMLYCLNVWAVYWLTLTVATVILPPLPGNSNKAKAALFSFATAALFTVLPLHSEVVSFIHARNVLLAGLFFVLSCIYYLKHIDSGWWAHIVAAFILFACALLSKATVIMLPLVLLLFLFSGPPIRTVRQYASVLPFVVLASIFFFIFKFQATESRFINDELIMTVGSNDFISRLAVAAQIPFFYLAKLLAPVGLSTEYQIEFSRHIFSVATITAVLGLCLLLSLTYVSRRRFPQALFALVWFLLCLLPVLNFFLTNPVVADRYVYLSSYAYAYLLAALLIRIGTDNKQYRLLIYLLPVLGIYSWMTFERNDVWRTSVTVMEDMTSPSSNQAKGFNNLGQIYFRDGQHAKALEYFGKAKAISPIFSRLEFHQAKLAFQQNRPREALKLLDKAARFNKEQSYDAWLLRGQIHESLGDLVQAARCYREAQSAVQPNRTTRELTGSSLQRVTAKLEPSLKAARREIAEHPGDLNKKVSYAMMLQNMGMNEQAIVVYEELLRLGGPRWEVYANLGKLHKQEGRLEQSIRNYQLSLSINKTSSRVHNELGIVFIEAGRFEEALEQFQTTVELDPGSANALMNLAKLHFQLGNDKSARELFNRVRIKFPEYQMLALEYLEKLSR